MTGKQTPGTMKPNSHIADMNKDKLHQISKKMSQRIKDKYTPQKI
jgi:hypothetical protein